MASSSGKKQSRQLRREGTDDGFDFAPALAPAPALKTNPSSKKAAATTSQPDKICTCCDAPAFMKTKYCEVHRRAFECIQRQAMRGWKEGMPGSEEVRAFKEIFGWRRKGGGDTLASRVLVDFVEKFPCAKVNGIGSASTKQRGTISLCQFLHSRVSFQQKSRVRPRAMMDYELFSRAMEAKRGWKE